MSVESPNRNNVRTIFLVLLSGAVLMAGVLLALRKSAPGEADPSLQMFSYLAPLLAAAAAGLALSMRQRLTERRRGTDLDEWWRANFPAAMLIWTAAELAILAGAVSYFLAGGVVGPLTAAAGVALLLLNAPQLIEPK